MSNLILMIPLIVIVFTICYMFMQNKEHKDNKDNIEKLKKLEELKAIALGVDDKNTADEIDKKIKEWNLR